MWDAQSFWEVFILQNMHSQFTLAGCQRAELPLLLLLRDWWLLFLSFMSLEAFAAWSDLVPISEELIKRGASHTWVGTMAVKVPFLQETKQKIC